MEFLPYFSKIGSPEPFLNTKLELSTHDNPGFRTP